VTRIVSFLMIESTASGPLRNILVVNSALCDTYLVNPV
jgi:hypothetical protein